MWLVNVLSSNDAQGHERLGEAFSVTLMSLLSDDMNVALAASSCLRTIVKLLPQLLNYSRDAVDTIITAISLIVSKLIVSVV